MAIQLLCYPGIKNFDDFRWYEPWKSFMPKYYTYRDSTTKTDHQSSIIQALHDYKSIEQIVGFCELNFLLYNNWRHKWFLSLDSATTAFLQTMTFNHLNIVELNDRGSWVKTVDEAFALYQTTAIAHDVYININFLDTNDEILFKLTSRQTEPVIVK